MCCIFLTFLCWPCVTPSFFFVIFVVLHHVCWYEGFTLWCVFYLSVCVFPYFIFPSFFLCVFKVLFSFFNRGINSIYGQFASLRVLYLATHSRVSLIGMRAWQTWFLCLYFLSASVCRRVQKNKWLFIKTPLLNCHCILGILIVNCSKILWMLVVLFQGRSMWIGADNAPSLFNPFWKSNTINRITVL